MRNKNTEQIKRIWLIMTIVKPNYNFVFFNDSRENESFNLSYKHSEILWDSWICSVCSGVSHWNVNMRLIHCCHFHTDMNDITKCIRSNSTQWNVDQNIHILFEWNSFFYFASNVLKKPTICHLVGCIFCHFQWSFNKIHLFITNSVFSDESSCINGILCKNSSSNVIRSFCSITSSSKTWKTFELILHIRSICRLDCVENSRILLFHGAIWK